MNTYNLVVLYNTSATATGRFTVNADTYQIVGTGAVSVYEFYNDDDKYEVVACFPVSNTIIIEIIAKDEKSN